MNMNTYMPVRLLTGKDSLNKSFPYMEMLGNKALIITDKTSGKLSGALNDVMNLLHDYNIEYQVFDDITANPKITECIKAAQIAHNFQADYLIGIGGGSCLDGAKCASVFAANPNLTIDDLYAFKWPNKPLPVVAVGTTAGTGSEVTKVSVVTTPEGKKKSFNHDLIYPVLSIGDPTYTLSLNEYYTISTAIDALSHAMESYFLRGANTLTQSYSISAIKLVLNVFEKLLNEGISCLTFEDREDLYNASIFGGLAINTTGTGFPHTMGYLLTEEYQVPHGYACAVFLTHFYYYNKVLDQHKTDRFLEEIGYNETTLFFLITRAIPQLNVTMSEEDIMRSRDRFINNSSIKKCYGDFNEDDACRILRDLFKK